MFATDTNGITTLQANEVLSPIEADGFWDDYEPVAVGCTFNGAPLTELDFTPDGRLIV